ncbi:hypothetical protein [Paraburkholderia unamae]|uniref:Uncharacterized protein n=1 Tax=Paraburkholderia unamae TaxID=219649 RepID=A0ABX5KS29_9BURK|nr:hypothetical protein [Paraburkholderia unamae]PVX84312.1 hypothetical protein C7402_105153 [Paraburkholderia unamae]
MAYQAALRQIFKFVVFAGIATAAFTAVAHAEQCNCLSTKAPKVAPIKPALLLPETPAGMDVDATGVVVNAFVAVGTFVAAAVALWAALSDRRKRNREALVVGRLTAAGIVAKLEEALAITSSVGERFRTAEAAPISVLEFQSMCLSVDSITHITFEEIKCLAPLSGDCASVVAAAQDRLDVVSGALRFLGEPRISPGERMIREGHCKQALEQSSKLFKHAKSICDSETSAVHEALGSAEARN